MKFLPIGTIVLLKEATKKVMIAGFLAAENEESKDIYDYVGFPYPEGITSSKEFLLFNHDQIKEVFYEGYKDESENALKNKFQKIIDNK